ncbi:MULTISPECIES: CoA ester lyase [unclassified Lysobacter]|uniref:HpcH/HpaI aldolase/citrate lyase family protein n=1 Tax=unclassified Lysobacter TaxID=2635362 RepID=UPI001BE7E1F5|nr:MULTISPECIES: CoA ester lyase [unclassified Lysobacter]MBT2745690.1 CoA ester lyase [Lysobacter sp. ISL-42]MBT2749751.1 CoA ester lyase [Lysobacter sp. ISL-50]MBT2777530.1 CoA ester lyase [Lysobacter sp. ISL-54]MBT2782018.1 CoA ester lyase [Lysobacter sp. ISL-52]
MRSKLFVPGTRPELFDKALAGPADALSFDLEDAVAEERKAAARIAVAAFVGSEAALASRKLMIVRVNAPDSPHFAADIAAVARDGVALINLPKIESAASLRAAVAAIERAQTLNQVAQPIGVLVNIETPRALAHAGEIACAHPRVAGLQLGLADLFEAAGIERYDLANVHAAMFAVRMAAAQADVFAIDSAYADLHDEAGYLAEARMARRLGFIGKSCLHPAQVLLANKIFAATAAELDAARRIVAAAAAAPDAGRGVFVVDGRMIDLPFLKRAQALLAAAERA